MLLTSEIVDNIVDIRDRQQEHKSEDLNLEPVFEVVPLDEQSYEEAPPSHYP